MSFLKRLFGIQKISSKLTPSDTDREYFEIIDRCVNKSTRDNATEEFIGFLQTSKIEVLTALLKWKGNLQQLTYKNFIFAIFDYGYCKEGAQVIWRIHTYCHKPEDRNFYNLSFGSVGNIISESLKTNNPSWINILENNIPSGYNSQFIFLLSDLRETYG